METKKLTILDYIALHGEQKTAIKLVNLRLLNFIGLTIDDLPDHKGVNELIEELTEILENNPNDKNEIKDVLRQINNELIEDILFY